MFFESLFRSNGNGLLGFLHKSKKFTFQIIKTQRQCHTGHQDFKNVYAKKSHCSSLRKANSTDDNID